MEVFRDASLFSLLNSSNFSESVLTEDVYFLDAKFS